MTRTFKSLVIALSSAGFLASAIGDVQACHPRARGGFGGGGGTRVIVVRAPQTQQVYQQPQAYPQQQLAYSQPAVVQGQNGQVGVQFQGTQTASATTTAVGALGGNASGVGVGGTSAVQGQAAFGSSQQGFVQQGQTAQTQVQSQVQGQGQSQTSIFGQAPTNQTQTQQAQFQQTQTQQVRSQPVQQAQFQTAQTQQVQPQQAQVQPAQAQPAQQTQNAQTLALEALSGLDSNEAVPTATQASAQSTQPQSTQPGLTGDFSASLQSLGATIRLRLNADGSFAWIVTTKDGKTTSYGGSFSMSNGRLTLARTDNQKLEASLTPTANGFSLKMIGQNASALSFVRV
jgi:hypothetical protein